MTSQRKAVSNYRLRRKRQGIERLEVQVQKSDVKLVRNIVDALGNPESSEETRSLLHERYSGDQSIGLKALIAAAPLDGVDLSRDIDHGRDIEL